MNAYVHVGKRMVLSRYMVNTYDEVSRVHRTPSHCHSYTGGILFVDVHVHIYSYHHIGYNRVDNDHVHT
jgi:hypothetical protein